MRPFYVVIQKLGIALLLFLTIALAGNALTYLNFDHTYGFLRLKQEAIATGWYLPFYYSHVLVAGLILIAGLIQLHKPSRKKWPLIHRWLGYFYIFGIIFFAAPGGLIMSIFIDRGNVVLVSFVLQTILWFYFTAIAFQKIIRKDINAHEHWMWRSYALTFAAVTLRSYIFIFSNWFSMTAPAAYATIALLSWIPNLLVVELIFWRKHSLSSRSAA